MLIEAGHFALALALGLSLIQGSVPLWGTRTNDPVLMSVAAPVALGVFACVAFAFASLVYAHATSDFSVLNVVENSHSAKPFIYKLSGVWGNHEGSLLLWVLILALFGALVATARASLPVKLRTNALAVQATVTTAFLLFILL
ncbi:MAG TPA: heme lyase NrfEFG subunit NrfE, partial [Enterovirga sp.]|nr:heme lyase NrfEFG subunit NrfE [Enterovirga sp.]